MRRRTIILQRTLEAKTALLNAQPEEPKHEDAQKVEQEDAPQERKVLGPKKLCPHCGKVPARYFHVKNCKGK